MSLEVLGPVGFRQFVLEQKCQESQGHTHNYDHATFIHRGHARITRSDGRVTEHGPGEWVSIAAELGHTIKNIGDGPLVYYCVFSHRDFDGLVSQKYVGNVQAYV